MNKFRNAAIVTMSIAVGAAMLSGCGNSSKRWCEHDRTDKVVSDSYCKNKTKGYEWESGSKADFEKAKKKS